MKIWMDMTYSMRTWKGGLIGIVRAELEIARNLRQINPDISFFVVEKKGFVPLEDSKMSWLWEADKVGDAYLAHMGRVKDESAVAEPSKNPGLPTGLEQAYAYSLGRMDRLNRFFHMCTVNTPKLVRFFPKLFFGIIKLPLEIVSKSRAVFLHKNVNNYTNNIEKRTDFQAEHPFSDGDMIFSAGWYTYDSLIKEEELSKLKNTLPSLKIAYLVYDMVLVNKNTAALFDAGEAFKKYLGWIADNCDYIFYGGETAKRDTEKYLRENDLPVRPGFSLKFGSELSRNTEVLEAEMVLEKYRIEGKYILAVGSVDAKKNYSTLYHAYTIMAKKYPKEQIPQLVIVGGKYGDTVLVEMMEMDPQLKNKIVFARPTDGELTILYNQCEFTVLPTWYEGWSLTLPESLNYGKFCLASDVAPLREIAGNLVDYVEPDDAMGWSIKIMNLIQHPEIVNQYNERIKTEWRPHTWRQCAEGLNKCFVNIVAEKQEFPDAHMFLDVSLIYNSCQQEEVSVSGILRTQLILTRYLCHRFPHLRPIALLNNKWVMLDRYTLSPILGNDKIDVAFFRFKSRLAIEKKGSSKKSKQERYSKGEIYWMFCSLLPGKLLNKGISFGEKLRTGESGIDARPYDLPFRKGDIFFTVGVGFGPKVYATIEKEKKKNQFKFIQLIYDLTPILMPQVHTQETRKIYPKFLERTAVLSDKIFYGGETAMRDGIAYEKRNDFPTPPAVAIKFGSNIVGKKGKIEDDYKKELLKRIGIKGKYIMAVGSIEARKNHETLYLAYLDMLKNHEDIPQMIFCGYPGWKTQEFLKRFYRDERIEKKIIIYTPNDEELEILYQNCEFTVLASLYEGWSLTLPESLNHGKFCISTDAAPMREIGGGLLEYVEAFDVKGWSGAIWKYYSKPALLEEKEKIIKATWNTITWKDCSEQIADELQLIYKEEGNDSE